MNRERVWLKYDKHCAYCGEEIEFKAMQVDHIVPKRHYEAMCNQPGWSLKGHIEQIHGHYVEMDSEENLNPSCRKCNNYKSDFSLEGFRQELSLQLERLNKTSTTYGRALRYRLIKETPKPIIFYFEQF